MKLLLGTLLLGLLTLLSPPAAAGPKMAQCEACTTLADYKAAARRSVGQAQAVAGVDVHVFSISKGVITSWLVNYEHETRVWTVDGVSSPANVEQAFALMLEANQLRPGMFAAAASSIFKGSIGNIGGGPHNPVAISLNGEHSSEFGSFIYYAKSCLASIGCANSINSALGKLAGADKLLNEIGIAVLGNLQWENVPPNIEVWLCDSKNDCALLRYNRDNGWTYVESRAEGGTGKRYPKYGERISYSFDSSGEAGVFRRGLEGGGASIFGSWTLRKILTCTSSGGHTHCEYVFVPE